MATTVVCGSCGQEMGADDRFCLECGMQRGADPVATKRAAAASAVPQVQNVRITGIDIPFWDLTMLLVWFSLAMIPAALILLAIGGVIFGILAAMGGGL